MLLRCLRSFKNGYRTAIPQPVDLAIAKAQLVKYLTAVLAQVWSVTPRFAWAQLGMSG